MEIKFKNGIVAAFAAGLSFASMQAAAEGLYIGAGVGTANVAANEALDDVGDVVADFDEDDTGYKIFAGYSFGFLGIEAGYIDFGAPNDSQTFDLGELGQITAGIEAEVTGFTIEAVGTLPLGPVDVFAKVGMISYDADVDVVLTDGETTEAVSVGDDGEELAYGVGATLNLGQFGIRAEYQLFDIGDDVDLLSLSAVLRF